ncbi:hypothetical protein ACFPPD_14100 [Cohnella suwonensis]|uniref:Uncharacterized protein n=1 Tax=Cohnella suwonensis TaxID=696072 RepID=A0ABW0LXZ7_9BACL
MELKPLVESVARELLDAWRKETVKEPPLPKVLYVFCDSTAHEAYSDHFIYLRSNGVCHDMLFLDGETSGWLGMHKLECGGAGRILAADEFAPAPLEVPRDYDGIVIPEIDLDNAARIALGMKGTVKAEIVFAALMQGKFVLAGEDSPGAKRSDRRTLRTISLPEPYEKLFSYYKQELAMYGVELAPQKRLADVVVDKLGRRGKPETEARNGGTSEAPRAPERNMPETANRLLFPGRLLSADWLAKTYKRQPFGELAIAATTIVTPLAKDEIKRYGIALTYADER